MKSIKILLLLLSLTACNNKTKTISTLDLEKVVINYKELPAPVKKKVFPPNNGLITFGEENREYSIDKDGPMGSRYIIYGDSLYISNHYNIYEEDSLQYTFTRYILR